MAISENKSIRDEICKSHINKGVVIIDSNVTYIDVNVKIGKGTIIYPNNVIEGNTIIGENCVIGPNNRIIDTKIANEVTIDSSVIKESDIGNKCEIGPFANIRANTVLKQEVKAGAFVELKNSIIDNETHIAHLTYVGDADVGQKVNFGCGTTIANYDGQKKHRCVIGDKCFIGCNTNLVSPVELGEGAYTAAGTTVTKNVPEYALVIGRAKETIIEEWARGKYKKQ